MKQAITTRELVTLDCSGTFVRGTYHKPTFRGSAGDTHAITTGQIGVLIVNSLTSPRAGHAGSSVYWAEKLAQTGYPCFRFDLPGLGDTGPEIKETTNLLIFITNGGYESIIGVLLKELADRFHLSGVIVMGHCAGAVTALYAGSKQRLCRGLILMDPYFNYPRIISRISPAVSIWSRHNRLGRLLRQFYDVIRDFQRIVRRDGLPPSANRPLLEQWRHVASRGLPILIVQSPSLKPGPGQFDYIRYAMDSAGRKAKITLELIPDTDHSFANLAGRQAVYLSAERWLAVQNLHGAPAKGQFQES